jgi:lysophospholipase L1-like esterase
MPAMPFAKIGVLLLVTTVCLEGVAQLAGVRSGWFDPKLYAPNPITVYGNRPDFQGDFAGAWVRINSEGVRGEEIPPRKSPGELRVLLLGDSLTFGQGVAQDQTFAAQLEARLQAAAAGATYRIINAGVPGFNTVNERDYLLHFGERFQPDLVVVFYVDNDADPPQFVGFDQEGVPLTATGTFTRQDWIGAASAFLYRHSSLYTSIRRAALVLHAYREGRGFDVAAYNRRAGARFADANPGFSASQEALTDMHRWTQARGIGFLVAVSSRLPPAAADTYRDAVAAFCTRTQIPFVVIPLVEVGERFHDFFIPWDGHPNERAHQRIAERLRAAVETLLPHSAPLA